MNEFLDRIFLGNAVREYVWVVAVILFVLLLNRIISKYIAILLCKVFKRTFKRFDQEKFISLIIHPLGIFLVISVTIVAFYRLNFPPELSVKIYKYSLDRILLTIAIAVQILVFTWLLLRIIDFIASVLEARAQLTPNQSDNQLVVFFRDFLKVIIGIVGLLLVLRFAFNYDVSSLLTGLSIVGAAIALALRESLENLIASFVIFFDKPFATGDFVKVQSVSGSVERIGLRSTRLRTADKSFVTVPNKQMVDSILDNITLRSQIRGELSLFIEVHTAPAKVEALAAAIKGHLAANKEVQNHTVLVNDIRIQGIVVFVEFFTGPIPWPQFTAVKQELNVFVLRKMEELEIAIQVEAKHT